MAVPQRIDEEFNQRYQARGVAANDSAYIKKGTAVTKQKVGVAANDPSFTEKRYKTADRTQQGIRNIRTESRVSSMPGSPRNVSVDDSHPDIATSFNQEYAKKGIQPRTLDDRPSPQPPASTKQINRSTQVTYSPRPVATTEKETKATKDKLKKKISKNTSWTHRRAKAVTISIWCWAGFSYLFQLPFALLSLLLFGAANLTNAGEDSFILLRAVSAVFGGATAAVWGVSHLILICYALFIILIIFLQYTLSGIKPLFGEAGGAKFAVLALAITGYSTPILNLVPWFLLWTWFVMKHPK